MKSTYKGITFAKGYNRPLADFKVEFGKTHIFMAIPEKKRNAEMKKVHTMVLKETKKWSASDNNDSDGNSKGSTTESKNSDS